MRRVREAVRRLSRATAAKHVDGALDCFTERAVVLGDAGGEEASGREELRAFLEEVFEEPWSLAWEVLAAQARGRTGAVWFAAEVDVLQAYPEGLVERVPARLVGVLEQGDAGVWRFDLLTLSQPVPAPPEGRAEGGSLLG
ncbi:nuclear transport factor 2 family protein [Nocardioides sp. GY 10127]|uniref:YybH family protein n=1 Tax=Nocardioides sp. GY 10127 TaxID=2569762 RepID=UPI001459125C|nr:nuclear transport factor 2 family protein [Nocardioides sp. GY 10127]